MIVSKYYHVVEGGFDWIGLAVQDVDEVLHIDEGRIGLSDRPLTITDNGVDGGFYVPSTDIQYNANDRSVDLLLHEGTHEVFMLVRSDDITEQYDATTYRLLLSLAYRHTEESPWLIATPLKEQNENY